MSHISDDCTIVDKNMKFGEYKLTQEYKRGLESVLREVRNGQHLRFIGNIYKTHEVCVIAVKNSPYYDIGSVPKEILNEVVNEIKEKHPYAYEQLSDEYKRFNEARNKLDLLLN